MRQVFRPSVRMGAGLVLGFGLLASACSSGTDASSGSDTTATTSTTSTATATGSTSTTAAAYATTVTSPGPVNPKAIPLGDGYVSTTPKVGSVDSCQTTFPAIGGAQTVVPWIDTATKTWNSVSARGGTPAPTRCWTPVTNAR